MENYISLLWSRFYAIESIDDEYQLNSWKDSTINVLSRIYSSGGEHQINSIKNIQYERILEKTHLGQRSGTTQGRNNLVECKRQATDILRTFVHEIELLGVPEPPHSNTKAGINISLNQNQSIQLNIVVDILKNELTGRHFQELDTVLKSNSTPEEKKKSLIEKLTSFGSDVASNVLASLLTNPQVFQALM